MFNIIKHPKYYDKFASLKSNQPIMPPVQTRGYTVQQ